MLAVFLAEALVRPLSIEKVSVSPSTAQAQAASGMPAKKKGGAGGKPSWTPVSTSLHPARSARCCLACVAYLRRPR